MFSLMDPLLCVVSHGVAVDVQPDGPIVLCVVSFRAAVDVQSDGPIIACGFLQSCG